MKKYINYIGLLSISIGIISCEPEFEKSVQNDNLYSSGKANFSKFVAVGNSLTSGYSDNSLYIMGQEASFPNMLAKQFKLVGGGEFSQPMMNDNIGGLLLNGTQIQPKRLVLGVNEEGNPSPMYIAGNPTTEVSQTLNGPFNNMGVPGAKSFHLLAKGYGNITNLATGKANPYFVRFRSSENASVMEDVVSQKPTFFTLWIGNNDVLSYATSGGTGTYQKNNLDVSTYSPNDITSPIVFDKVYRQEVEMLMQSAKEGVLIDIPGVSSAAFFHTVPYNPLSPKNPDFGPLIPLLNQVFGSLNQAFNFLGEGSRSIIFSETEASPVVIHDESLTDISEQLIPVLQTAGLDLATATIYAHQYGQCRQATDKDLMLLTSSKVIGTINQEYMAKLIEKGIPQNQAAKLSVSGVTLPLEDKWVLIPSEQAEINEAVEAYNQTIKSIAKEKGLAFVDSNAMLNELANGGIVFDGGIVTSAFATGGAFSLDGIHLTPRGYAIVANKIIHEINKTYQATIPPINVGIYRGTPAIGPTN